MTKKIEKKLEKIENFTVLDIFLPLVSFFHWEIFFSTKFYFAFTYDNLGDHMKLNLFIPILCAILLGYLCASFIFEQYGITSFSFSEKGTVYMLQCGAYTTESASKEEIPGVEDKITIKEGNKYYSYIGMTSSKKNALAIQEMYQKQGVSLYIKDTYLDNDDFINELSQYDVLLENSDTLEEVNSVLKTILATYDEIIQNS